MSKWAIIDELAEAEGVGPEARRKWRERGRVASRWHLRLLAAAQRRKLPLTAADLLSGPDTTVLQGAREALGSANKKGRAQSDCGGP